MTLYANTTRNAHHVGWALLPEFCIGDREQSAFVIHDHVKGLFYFVNLE